MLISINVPDIGFSDKEVLVTEILVKTGDIVNVDQTLIVVEGDKASVEIPSIEQGKVIEIQVKIGDTVIVGSPIIILEKQENVLIDNNIINQKNEVKNIKLEENKKNNIEIYDDSNNLISCTIVINKKIFISNSSNNSSSIVQYVIKDIFILKNQNIQENQLLMVISIENQCNIDILSPYSGIVESILVDIGSILTEQSEIMYLLVNKSYYLNSKIIECRFNKKYNFIENDVIKTKIYNKNLSQNNDVLITKNQVGCNLFEENKAYQYATPAIRQMARSFGVNLNYIVGTGRKGRILYQDVQNYIKNILSKEYSLSLNNNNQSNYINIRNSMSLTNQDFSKFGCIEEVSISRINKISAENLYKNWITAPHVTQFYEADITNVEDFRKKHNIEFQNNKSDIKLTLLVFIIKAIYKSLIKMPLFNSSLSNDGSKVILKKYFNIGIAVDTEHGLVVPVIKSVNNKSIIELSNEIINIVNKARSGKLLLKDMEGSCFTISNLGNFGGSFFTPIINLPEVAILGVSKAYLKPVWNGEIFIPKLMLPLSLSYDHRVINGADGARFISYFSNIMSDIGFIIM